MKDAQVANSPYSVPISALADYPSASFSYAKGPGLEAGNTTALPTSFSIFSLNHKGEPIPIKPDSFDVFIIGLSPFFLLFSSLSQRCDKRKGKERRGKD